MRLPLTLNSYYLQIISHFSFPLFAEPQVSLRTTSVLKLKCPRQQTEPVPPDGTFLTFNFDWALILIILLFFSQMLSFAEELFDTLSKTVISNTEKLAIIIQTI